MSEQMAYIGLSEQSKTQMESHSVGLVEEIEQRGKAASERVESLRRELADAELVSRALQAAYDVLRSADKPSPGY